MLGGPGLFIGAAWPVRWDGLAAVPRPLRNDKLVQREGLFIGTAWPVHWDGLACSLGRPGLFVGTAWRPFPDLCGMTSLSRGRVCSLGRPGLFIGTASPVRWDGLAAVPGPLWNDKLVQRNSLACSLERPGLFIGTA